MALRKTPAEKMQEMLKFFKDSLPEIKEVMTDFFKAMDEARQKGFDESESVTGYSSVPGPMPTEEEHAGFMESERQRQIDNRAARLFMERNSLAQDFITSMVTSPEMVKNNAFEIVSMAYRLADEFMKICELSAPEHIDEYRGPRRRINV